MQFHPKDLSDLDELTEEHLGFSALSDGLGFSQTKNKVQSKINPSLEEELALKADTTKKMALSGTGAVAAGMARPAPAMFQTRAATAPAAVLSPLAQPAAPQWIRSAAFLVDALIVLLPLAGAWIFSFRDQSLELLQQDFKSPLLLVAVIFSMYFLLSESFGGQSLGKMMFNLHVVEDDKYQKPIGFRFALPRAALFLIGSGFFGIGLLASFVDSKKRPWHDRYSGSIVRRKN